MFFILLTLLTIYLPCTIFLVLQVFDNYGILVWFALMESRKKKRPIAI